MNNKKRALLQQALELRDKMCDIISGVLDEEQECLNNMPENLQISEKYERMEAVIELLEESLEQLDNAEETIVAAME